MNIHQFFIATIAIGMLVTFTVISDYLLFYVPINATYFHNIQLHIITCGDQLDRPNQNIQI